MYKNLFLILLSTVLAIQSFAAKRRVLFIGNSYIFTNNLPSLLQQMATATGDTLIYDENTIGGATMQMHSTDPNTLAKINSQQWDIVILQEQSQRPAFSPAQVASDTYPYARKLDSLVRKNKSCTETMFFMTWGYKTGDPSNCGSYPPICTYEGMQQRLRESYLQMAQDNGAIVSPVGAAWKQVRDSFPSIDLYSPDNSHPSISGSYLAACVFYASIFHKSPVKNSFLGGLNATDAANLQRIAGKVVLDSFNKWNQYGNYTYANFTKAISGNMATFTNTSVYATSNYWTFGNGNTSTTTSPVHTYSATGKYQVTLTASNTCFSETKKDSITIASANINAINNKPIGLNISSLQNSTVLFSNTGFGSNYTIEVFDMSGRKMAVIALSANSTHTETFIPGLYMYQVFENKQKVYSHKFSVQ